MKCTILHIVEVWKFLNRSMKNHNLTCEDWPRCNQKLTENRICTMYRTTNMHLLSKQNICKILPMCISIVLFRNKYAPNHRQLSHIIMKLNLTDSLRCRVVAISVFYGIDLLVVSILQFIWGDNNIDRNEVKYIRP